MHSGGVAILQSPKISSPLTYEHWGKSPGTEAGRPPKVLADFCLFLPTVFAKLLYVSQDGVGKWKH